MISLNWGGSSLPYGERQHRRPKREDFDEDVHPCSINCYVIMRICCCRELFLLDRRYNAKNYWPSKLSSFIPEVALCAWTHTVLIIACLVTSTLYANETVTRQSLHVHQWCSFVRHQQHVIVRKRLLAKFIFFYI